MQGDLLRSLFFLRGFCLTQDYNDFTDLFLLIVWLEKDMG